jgi:hypothetical protein
VTLDGAKITTYCERYNGMKCACHTANRQAEGISVPIEGETSGLRSGPVNPFYKAPQFQPQMPLCQHQEMSYDGFVQNSLESLD